MAEIHEQHRSLPPQKHRDPNLIGRSQDELRQNNDRYIGATVNSAARDSLQQGTMAPTSIPIRADLKKKLLELKERLGIEESVLLRMAFHYGYTEAKKIDLTADELRKRIGSVGKQESVEFEIDESILDIISESGIEDAQFIYLNSGLDLLHSRLVPVNAISEI